MMIQTQRLVQMTPEWASQLDNSRNRPLTPARVEYFVDAILADRFSTTHQGMALDQDGYLLDGGHRRAAIIVTGRTVTVWLAENCDRALYTKIDTGRQRGPGSTLKQLGCSYAPQVAAAAKMIILFKLGETRLGVIATRKSVPNSEVVAFVQNYSGLEDSAMTYAVKVYVPGLSQSLFTAVHFLLSERHPSAADLFCHQLKVGDLLAKDNPVLVLREKITGGTIKKGLVGTYILKAWEKWGQGLSVKELKLSKTDGFSVAFPKYYNKFSLGTGVA